MKAQGILALALGLMVSAAAFGQTTYLPNTEVSVIDKAELVAKYPDATKIEIVVGRDFSVDLCNGYSLLARPEYSNQSTTQKIEFNTNGLVNSTRRACGGSPGYRVQFLHVGVNSFGVGPQQSGLIEIKYPEGYKVKYKVITSSGLIDL